jgi:predicted TIM-barrel fold metal-dependent hydrolase
MVDRKVIIVSGDSHATPSPEVWPHYVEEKYRHLLAESYEDNEKYVALLGIFSQFSAELLEVIDTDGVWRSGLLGAWDCDVRLAQMDREGVAAEVVFAGDSRAQLPLSQTYHRYSQDVVAAGVRMYHRWAADAFGKAKDRILVNGNPSSQEDMGRTLAELEWTAEHGFFSADLPTAAARKLPALYHEYWDPFWAACEDMNITLVCHAGYADETSENFFEAVEGLRKKMIAEGRNDLLNEIMNSGGRFFSTDLRPRRAMWQMMLGGVFDRHPRLRLMMAEVRGDWLPATLAHLDAAYEQHRDDLPARSLPSDYWQSNCFTALSFIHKSEVGMRHEIGLETITFGRDYPHAESTWPNTADWLSDAFAGVPENELRLMLGENAIRFFGLDRSRLAAIAERIGPRVEDVAERRPELDPQMVANWDARGGYLKPPEAPDPDAIDELLNEDLALVGSGS